jgi:hypothetical protein
VNAPAGEVAAHSAAKDAADSAANLAANLATEVVRLADRLRSLTDVRLARPLPPYGSRADAGHAVAQLMADSAAELSGEPQRPVPRLHDFAVADQIAVTGADLVRVAGSGGAPGESGKSGKSGKSGEPAESRESATRVAEALARCRELNSAL